MLRHAHKLSAGVPVKARIAECGVKVPASDKKVGLTVSLHAVNCKDCIEKRLPGVR